MEKPNSLRLILSASILGVYALFLAGCATTQQTNRAGFQNLQDAVVRLDVWETTFSNGAKRTRNGVGSGVIMTKEGHVLTNAHVVNPYAERILITLNNLERVPAKLVGWDHWTDLAVVQIDVQELTDKGLGFSVASFGDSQLLKPGDSVYAVGTPNGLSRTVTRGIISNNNRFFEGTHVGRGYETGYFNTWLQTDAAINPGNSGGPLVNNSGAVIGINTRSYLGANNLSFAVPSQIAKTVMQELIEQGEVNRSYLGVVPGPLQDLESFYNLEVNTGVLVQSVDPGSPASEAGLRPSDILLEIDGNAVDGRFPEQLPAIQNLIASRPVGSQVTFKLKRGDEVFEQSLVTETLQSRVGEEYAFEDWGLSVQKISRTIARERQLESDDGVMVIGIQPAFPAEQSGVRRGDVIVKVNRNSVTGLEEVKNAYSDFQEEPSKVLLEVLRHHQVSYFVMKP